MRLFSLSALPLVVLCSQLTVHLTAHCVSEWALQGEQCRVVNDRMVMKRILMLAI